MPEAVTKNVTTRGILPQRLKGWWENQLDFQLAKERKSTSLSRIIDFVHPFEMKLVSLQPLSPIVSMKILIYPWSRLACWTSMM